MSNEFLTPDDLVARWAGMVSRNTLANWRAQGRGPAFIKLGGRIVYRRADVDAWEEQNTIRRDVPAGEV